MKIAICDNEQEYRVFLKQMISFYCQDRQIEFSCFNFDSGEALLQSGQHFDILFLDIEMNGLNGIETAKEINRKNRDTIIFIVTAYQKYLDAAMDLDIFRYIDKPINQQRVYAGLDKAVDFLNHNRITFKTRDDGFVYVRKSDIIYVEVTAKNVYVVTSDKKYSAREKMDYFKEKLSTPDFVIPHHSYIVNLNFVIQFKRNSLQMIEQSIISIAPKKQALIKKKFMYFMGEDNGSLSDDF